MKMKQKLLPILVGLMLVVFSVAAPNDGFALLVDKTDAPVAYSYINMFDEPAVLAEVYAEVYQGSYEGVYSDGIDVELAATDFLYVYEIKNVDFNTPLSEIGAYSIGKTADAVIDLDRAGALSGDPNIHIGQYPANILVSGLSIQPNALEVIYFVTDHMPNWFDSYAAGTWASPHADILAPNQLPQIPEPTTLLLVGTALIGVAGMRRFYSRK